MEQAVLIIDEYDASLLDVMDDKIKLLSHRRSMRNIYRLIKNRTGRCEHILADTCGRAMDSTVMLFY